MITLLHEQREAQWPDAAAEGDALWLDAAGVEAATGWAWKPEGPCHGDTCVPLPRAPGDGGAAMVRDGRLNLAAAWRHSGQPVVRDARGRAWVLGTGSARRGASLVTLQAPDFALPELQGTCTGCRHTAAARSSSPPGRRGEGVALTCPCGSRCSTN